MRIFPTELVEQCKQSDAKAQRGLFDFYYAYMFNVCQRYLRDEMHTEDMLSQGFTKVFKHIGQFNYTTEIGLRAWIKRIMINECLMWLRKKNNFNLVPLTDANEVAHDDIHLEGVDVQYILTSIAALPMGYQTVLNLHVVEGYSHAEISSLLNIKEATSRSQLNKAKQALKHKLLHYRAANYGKR